MRFCDAHWERLGAEIKKRGMWPLVARDGGEALQRAVEEIQGTATDATYDPLMACHWMIAGRAMETLGLYLLNGGGGVDLCPVCEVVRVHGLRPCEHGCTDADVEQRWLEGPADAALRHVQASPVLQALLEVV